MPRRAASSEEEQEPRAKAASTPEAREAQMIELADALAEKQLREGNASSQVITHYLKLGSSRERLEQEKIKIEKRKLEAQVEQIAQAARTEELFTKAIRAIRSYQGVTEPFNPFEEEGDDQEVF
jgi:chorismate synthase